MAWETTGVNDRLAAGCNLVFRLKDDCSWYQSIFYQPHDIILIMFWKSFEMPLVTGRTFCDGAHYCCLNKLEDISRNTLRIRNIRTKVRIRAYKILASLPLKFTTAHQVVFFKKKSFFSCQEKGCLTARPLPCM